jgi:hypothetical protein
LFISEINKINYMKKIFLFILILFTYNTIALAQVGIGTPTPAPSAILDVNSTEQGVLLSRMTSTQRVAIASPAKGLMVFDTTTNSFWYYDGAFWVNSQAIASYGDIKSGIQAADHNGWVKLDGRLTSTLSATQRTVLSSLGISTNLPNASDSYLVQKTGTLGSVSGSNTTTIAQANLPNVTFTGTAQDAGSHNHNVDPGGFWAENNGNHNHNIGRRGNPDNGAFDPGDGRRWENSAATTDRSYYGEFQTSSSGNHSHWIDVPNTTSTTFPNHSHTVNVGSGGSGTALNIAPKSMIVNMFIYLGN